MSQESGICFQVQRYAIHDGPGIRTTVFLKGCPLSCSWCHNPEGRSHAPELHLFPDRCIACGRCLDPCPRSPMAAVSEPAVLATPRPGCLQCGKCAEACPAEARTLVGRTVTVAELLDRIERDRPFHEESGGGATFSGGEPLAQGSFLLSCLEDCRGRGVHTAVDTCGYADRDLVLAAGRRADLILFDLKLLHEERHRALTGVSFEPIGENLRALDRTAAEVWIRVPFLPGINDDEESVECLGRWVRSLRRIRRVHLLPYHRAASRKYERMQAPYGAASMETSAPERIEAAAKQLLDFGLDVRIGG